MIKVEIYLLWFTYMCVQLFKFSVKMLQVYNSCPIFYIITVKLPWLKSISYNYY